MGAWLQRDADWNWKTLTYARYNELMRQSKEQFGHIIATDNPNLSAFRNAGGKMIIWHGWNDQLIFPEGTIQYYQNVIKTMGGIQATSQFARLFMVPGVEHCRGGAGPDKISGFNTLVNWVERDESPAVVMAKKVIDGRVVRELPLCPWPRKVTYRGVGDTNAASSYSCK
jgi:hypothetical protein